MNTNSTKGYKGRLRRERINECLACCKKFVAFFFSQVGLCCLVVAYSIMGGFLFKTLEAENEMSQKSTMLKTRQRHVERLWNLTIELNILYRPNWTLGASAILHEFQHEVYKATKEKGWDGKDASQEIQWSFAGALLYSVTVITTIGYGHIAPKTAWGRFMTIVYAIFGIPLTLLCLANVGGLMANIFRFIYSRVCCGFCCICCKKKKKHPRRMSSMNSVFGAGNKNGRTSSRRKITAPVLSGTTSKGSIRSTSHNSMNPPPSPSNRDSEVYRPPGRDSEVYRPPGQHSEVYRPPGRDSEVYRPPGQHSEVYSPPGQHSEVFGPPNRHSEVYGSLNRNSEVYSPPNQRSEVLVNAGDLKIATQDDRLLEPAATTPLNAPAHMILHETDLECETDMTDDELGEMKKSNKRNQKPERVTVPITLCIMLMAGYIFGGAVLFTLWEHDWDYLIGSYFCFVTLSTIGFGDFVPGASMDSWSSQEKQVLCTMYLLFGLAFIAMCFELMQEEVRAKFRWLGTKIGIFKQEKD
ncbi:potassium channel subfamily K member 18-like [Lineus longissimus]|uniref:potassium channel subfamily K member 18-like n=1 Tax=Lineus longissimus TaxID=88925 RepID=UPI00315DB6BC